MAVAPTLAELVVEARERGRTTAPLAWHTTTVLPGLLRDALGLDVAPPTAVAVTERDGSARLDAITTRAVRAAEGSWSLTGAKGYVAGAGDGTRVVVVARADDGLALFSVARDAPGVVLTPLSTIGLDDQCDVELHAAPATLLAPTIDRTLPDVIARAVLVLCGDALGAAQAALDHTVAHVRTRRQFGVPIGSFQAVQHRCADMLADLTLAGAMVTDAVDAVARGDDVLVEASRTKAFVVDACRRVTASAHQLGGGEGIHADQPLHLWYRRVKAIEPVFGGPDHHRAVVAAALLDR
jgi:alkylation response protein AidB-like acyl-CoA dehydrogenase